MSDNCIILYRALQNVEQELERLGGLIDAQRYTLPDHLQGELGTIRTLFNTEWRALRDARLEIATHISQAEIGTAWTKYAHLRYERLPKLTGELLAAIGGIHLRQVRLDKLGDLDKQDRNNSLSFTDVAEHLVSKDLRDRSGLREQDLPMLLIVAEERHEASDASILRLRFPAFDIWHLPFVAYEFGYHFARKANEASLARLRDEVKDRVDPKNYYVQFSLPEDATCYLPEVQTYWPEFDLAYLEIREPEKKLSFWKLRRSKIEALQNRQLVIFCRLLADAFATFYVGPAYTYTLLHLSFSPIKVTTGNASDPGSQDKEEVQSVAATEITWGGTSTPDNSTLLDEPVSPWMPPFIQRLVVSLETLRWMNKERLAQGSQSFDKTLETLFVEDPVQTGILGTYYRTCMAINDMEGAEGFKECYDNTKLLLDPWLKKFQALFSVQQNVQEKTAANWNQAKALLRYIEPEDTEDIKIEEEFSLWGVINAAWHARHLSETERRSGTSSQTSTIEQRAMELIIQIFNREASKGAAGQQSGLRVPLTATGQTAQQIRQAHIGNMWFALDEAEGLGNKEVVILLRDMVNKKTFIKSSVVSEFLKEIPSLGDQYLTSYNSLVKDDKRPETSSDGFATTSRGAVLPVQGGRSDSFGRKPHETRAWPQS